MSSFGPSSLVQIATLHSDLAKILVIGIQRMDFTVVEGYRGKVAQNQAYAKGYSKLKYPSGNHNQWPSLAVDCAPYPVDWSDQSRALERFVFMQGIFWSVSLEIGIPIRQGIDWNRNQDMRDEHGLHDYPHLELWQPRTLTAVEIAAYPSVPL